MQYFACSDFFRQCRNRRWVRWELERLLAGQLCQECSYQKLLKSGNHQVTIVNVVDPFLRHSV